MTRDSKVDRKKLIRDFVREFMTLAADPVFEDSDECERKKDTDGLWKCFPRAGKTCSVGRCKFVTITMKVDGVEKTVTHCMCA